MSEREKGQTTESWGWAGRRPPDWADFRGSRGRRGTWPASACARGTSAADLTHGQTPSHRQSSHLLNFSWGPRPCVAPHNAQAAPGLASRHTNHSRASAMRQILNTPNVRCRRQSSPIMATQRDRLPCLLHTILADPAPTDVVRFQGWTAQPTMLSRNNVRLVAHVCARADTPAARRCGLILARGSAK